MDNKLYSIKQVCRIQNCDINQLHDRIKTDKNRLLVYLKNTVVFEAKINEIDDSELSRLHLISDEDMKEEFRLHSSISRKFNPLRKSTILSKKGKH